MKWVVSEMEEVLPVITESFDHAPSDVTRTTVHGILGRIYLYMYPALQTKRNTHITKRLQNIAKQ